MSKKITLPSGASLDITIMPFETSWGVSQAVIKELGRLEVDSSVLDVFKKDRNAEIDLAELFSLKNPICAVLSNPVFVEAAKTCFVKCTYKSMRINEDTFEDQGSRGDFIPAVYYVLLENISPFFTNLTSVFSTK